MVKASRSFIQQYEQLLAMDNLNAAREAIAWYPIEVWENEGGALELW